MEADLHYNHTEKSVWQIEQFVLDSASSLQSRPRY